MSQETIVTKLELQAGYKFVTRFEQQGLPPLLMDEPFPVGEGTAPNASQVLSAAVGNCLSASALFCFSGSASITAICVTVTSSLAPLSFHLS